MNTLKPTINMAKLQIPTGYEQLQRQAATKRRLAETMLAQGLTPENNMQSWVQALGKLSQVWAGSRMNKKADEAEVGYQTGLRKDFETSRAAFADDVAAGMTAQQLIEKHGGSPFLEEDLKPYRGVRGKELEAPVDIATADTKDANGRVIFGGQMTRRGSVMGQYDNDPTKMVHANPDGSTQLNPVAVTAAAIGQGNLAPTEYATTGQMPGTAKVAQAMAGAQPAPQQQGAAPEAVDEQGLLNLKGTMTEGQLGNYLRQGNIAVRVNTPEDVQRMGLPPGTKIILPDGTAREVM